MSNAFSFPSAATRGAFTVVGLAFVLAGSLLAIEPAPSTRQMAERLAAIRQAADPLKNPFRSSDQLPILRRLIAQATDPQQKLDLRLKLAGQLLTSGDNAGALAEFKAISESGLGDVAVAAQLAPELMLNEALCHLRMGEVENCLLNHNADSCLFPIKGGGVHQRQQGSRDAVAILTGLLTRYPGDLRARWLLNIAYMTLGEYPAKVPPAWLLDPKLFQSDYPLPRYPDVAAQAGVDLNGLAGGVVLEDFDHDGFLDLMISGWGLTDQLRFYHNNGDGTFAERTEEAGLIGEQGGLNLIHTDYNNDGWADVLVLRGGWLGTEGRYPVSLLRNQGNGTFVDVTVAAGLKHEFPSQSAVWFDFNNDGWLDLFIVNESTGTNTQPCELYRNNGDGTFTECAEENGVAFVGFFKGVVSGDYNNDGRPDLFLSSQDRPKMLLRNDGPVGGATGGKARWHFTDVAEEAGVTDPPASFPCWFWDYDNDGWLDIMVTGYFIQDVGDIAADYLGFPHAGQRAKLYHNNHDGTFTDVSKQVGLNKILHTMGCNFGDLDNDGWLDFYLGTGDPKFTTLIPNRMFRNDGGKRFQDVTSAGGFGQLQKGHAIAFGDINNDGHQDIFSKVGGAVEADNYHSQLFANPGNDNHWLKLSLEGVQTNRLALGVRVAVIVDTGAGERAIHRVVGTGASFGSSTVRQEIGLGQAKAIKRVELFWPVTGKTQVLTGLELDHAYQVKEGATAAVPMQLKSFAWQTGAAAHAHHHH